MRRDRFECVRRIGDRSRRTKARWVQRIREQVVIPDILVAPVQRAKIVPLVLFDPQSRNVVGIAAVAKVAERQIVEEDSPVIDRPHVHGVIEQPHAGTQVFKRVVIVQISADHAVAVAELDGLLNVVVSGGFPRGLVCRHASAVWSGSCVGLSVCRAITTESMPGPDDQTATTVAESRRILSAAIAARRPLPASDSLLPL